MQQQSPSSSSSSKTKRIRFPFLVHTLPGASSSFSSSFSSYIIFDDGLKLDQTNMCWRCVMEEKSSSNAETGREERRHISFFSKQLFTTERERERDSYGNFVLRRSASLSVGRTPPVSFCCESKERERERDLVLLYSTVDSCMCTLFFSFFVFILGCIPCHAVCFLPSFAHSQQWTRTSSRDLFCSVLFRSLLCCAVLCCAVKRERKMRIKATESETVLSREKSRSTRNVCCCCCCCWIFHRTKSADPESHMQQQQPVCFVLSFFPSFFLLFSSKLSHARAKAKPHITFRQCVQNSKR